MSSVSDLYMKCPEPGYAKQKGCMYFESDGYCVEPHAVLCPLKFKK